MKVIKLNESGYREAFFGMSLSYHDGALPWHEWFDDRRMQRAAKVALRLANRDQGHNKFLRAINVWILVKAPRYWWQEFDQYKVGSTSLSASTMHTLASRPPEKSDYADGTPWWTRAIFHLQWHQYREDIQKLKQCLPESFIQTRMVSLNYAVLREIIKQRHNHRLPEWQEFISQLLEQVEHKELLP